MDVVRSRVEGSEPTIHNSISNAGQGPPPLNASPQVPVVDQKLYQIPTENENVSKSKVEEPPPLPLRRSAAPSTAAGRTTASMKMATSTRSAETPNSRPSSKRSATGFPLRDLRFLLRVGGKNPKSKIKTGRVVSASWSKTQSPRPRRLFTGFTPPSTTMRFGRVTSTHSPNEPTTIAVERDGHLFEPGTNVPIVSSLFGLE